MTPDFQRLISEATRLMRSGSLGEATAAIQQALGTTPIAPGSAAAMAARAGDADVIDVEARVVGETPASSDTAPRTHAESFTTGHFKNECGARDYKLFVPPGDRASAPLVVMLHGCTQDPDDFARGTRMNALARAHGFLVLYPSQSQRANAQRC